MIFAVETPTLKFLTISLSFEKAFEFGRRINAHDSTGVKISRIEPLDPSNTNFVKTFDLIWVIPIDEKRVFATKHDEEAVTKFFELVL